MGGGGGGVNGWPLPFFSVGDGTAFAAATTNTVYVTGFVLSYALTFAHITINVGTADAANLYDVGVYTKAGALVANIGAQHLPTTGAQTFATLQGSKNILPGLYAWAFTGNAATAQLAFDFNLANWGFNFTAGASSGGALPASISAIAASPSYALLAFGLS
jgi:hypothetical protein